MTTPSTERKAGPLLGTGAQTTWPFTFKVFAATDIAVTIADSLGVETALVYGVDYTVTLNANQETSPGGTVTYPISGSPLPTGSRLVIVGNLPYDQPLDLPAGGNFSPLALENELDRLTMQIQQLRERVGRALQVSVTTGANVGLPAPSANELIGWDSTGQNLQNFGLSELATAVAYATMRYDTFTGDGIETQFTLTADPVTLANLDVAISGVTQVPGSDYSLVNGVLVFASAPANGTEILARYGEGLVNVGGDSSDIRFLQAGTGAVDRTVQAKLRESVSLLDFGADPTGTTPCSAEVQAAIDAVSAAGGGTIYVPPGTYVIRNIFMKDNVSIVGDGWASYFKLHWEGASPSNDWKVFTCNTAAGIDNVEFINVRVDGQQSEHGLSNLQMHGIECRGANNNWLIQGCYIYNCGGDPIIVSKFNSDTENPPANIRIIGNTCVYAGRQGLSVTQCNGVSIVGNYVYGPLDLEADDINSKFYHCTVSGNVVRGNLNVNLYTADGRQDNDTTIVGNAAEYITLVACNNVVVSGNTITTALRYGTNYNVLIEGCTMPSIDKIGGERSTRMVVRNCTIGSAAVDAVAFEVADVNELIIDSCVISATHANGQAIFHSNVKSFTPTNDSISIRNCKLYGGVRGINVVVNSSFGTTNYKIENCDIRSASTNQVIVKDGSGSAGGTFSLLNCTVNNQVSITKCVGLVSLVGMRFENAGSAVVLDNNTDAVFELDDWTFVTAAATVYMRNCTNVVSLYVGKVHSVGTSNSIALNFSGNTGTPTVWFDGPNATSTTWYGTVPGTVRTGSYYKLLGDTVKRGQWYNGTSWVNIT